MISIARLKHIVLSATAIGLVAAAVPALAQGTAPVAATGAPSTEAALEGLDAYIEKARADWQMPGLSIVIVKDDKIVYAKGFGVRELGKPDKVDADTIFAMGSTTKAFTAAALSARGVEIPADAWDGLEERLPAHLRVTYRVEDGDRVVGEGPSLEYLQRELAPKAQAAVARAVAAVTGAAANPASGANPASAPQMRPGPHASRTSEATSSRLAMS